MTDGNVRYIPDRSGTDLQQRSIVISRPQGGHYMAEWMDGIDKIQAVSSGDTSPAARGEAATKLMRKVDRFLGEGPKFWPLAVMYRTGGVPQGEIWTVLWGREAMGQATRLLERLVPPEQRIDPWSDDARWPAAMWDMTLVDVRRCLQLVEDSGVDDDGYAEAMKIVHEYREQQG